MYEGILCFILLAKETSLCNGLNLISEQHLTPNPAFVAGSIAPAESFVTTVPLFVSHHPIPHHTLYICTYYMYMNAAKDAFSLLFDGVLMHAINVSFTANLNNDRVEPLRSMDYSWHLLLAAL